MYGILFLLACAAVITSGGSSSAETLFVDDRRGNDANPGTNESPLKTIEKAVRLVNGSSAPGPSTVKIAPGLYAFHSHCLIENKRPYSKKERLTIEAAVLPGEPGWTPESMPAIVTLENPDFSKDHTPFHEIFGFDVEISHVTIRGLKFLGSPITKVLYYPIYRKGKSLDDLEVSQCMFLCDRHVISSNVAVIANGHGLRVDHCVFYQCANAVVFWNADGGTSRGNAMTHCIVDGGYVSGIWLCGTDEDFEFHHNIVTNCRYAWMRSETNGMTYRVRDSIINCFQYYSGASNPSFELRETDERIRYIEQNVVKTGEIQLEKGIGLDMEIPGRYMHVAKDTAGYELMAGLFKETP